MKVPKSMDDVLETALDVNATNVTIEYDSSRDLEITFYIGNTGIGVAVSDSAEQRRIISELVARSRRGKRTIRVKQNGRVRVVHVSERDHFGESAFDLRFDT